MSLRYYFRVLYQAVEDTLIFFDFHEPIKLVRALFLPVVTFFVTWQTVGFSAGMISLSYPVFYSAVIILAMVIIVLATSLYFAPAKIDDGRIKKIAELEADKAALKVLLE